MEAFHRYFKRYIKRTQPVCGAIVDDWIKFIHYCIHRTSVSNDCCAIQYTRCININVKHILASFILRLLLTQTAANATTMAQYYSYPSSLTVYDAVLHCLDRCLYVTVSTIFARVVLQYACHTFFTAIGITCRGSIMCFDYIRVICMYRLKWGPQDLW